MMDCAAIMRNYSRYLLVFFNLIFSITGIIILSVGVTAKAYYHEFDTFLQDGYIYVSDLLIITGVIIFLIAFFGCCGAIKENACMTTTFSTLLIIIFILEVVAGACGIFLKHNTEDYLINTLDSTISKYGNDSEITQIWDKVQREYKCCGVKNYTDWLDNPITNHTLPMSCCEIQPGTMNSANCTAKDAYQAGCLEEFGDFVRSHTSIIEGVALGLAIAQLLGIFLSCYLAKSIRSDYETV